MKKHNSGIMCLYKRDLVHILTGTVDSRERPDAMKQA